GFPAKYGDKLSSVVAVTNKTDTRKNWGGNLTAGGTGLAVILNGPNPGGSWIFSWRKSLLKEAVEILNPTEYQFSPSFYDLQSKMAIHLNKNNRLIGNILLSRDHSYLERWRGDAELYSNYGNSYFGLVWNSVISPTIAAEVVLSQGRNFWDNHIGAEKEEKLKLTENVFNWNLNFQPFSQHDVEGGITYKNIQYNYELKAEELSRNQQVLEELIESFYGDSRIDSRTYKLAAYIQDKFKMYRTLYANLGGRYDYFEFNRDGQWSPRVGLSLGLSARTIIRAAWGFYYQAPVYTELTKEKGHDKNPAAEKAIHYVLGFEHNLTSNFNLRIEGYLKKLEHMIGHYIEIHQPENEPILHYGNPNKGECKGIEFFLNGKLSRTTSLWFSYSYSQTTLEAYLVNWEKEIIEKKVIPRFTDQPHNLSMFMIRQFPKSWELNLKWRYLSGNPYTPRYEAWSDDGPYWKSGEEYSARYPAYHRLDVRVGKKFYIKNMQTRIFLEVKNAYYHKNVLVYNYKIENGTHLRKVYYTLPILPTIEFSIDF
ncbi:TonB-dependent receptor, partial [candidate division KSB1 bacterium]|nr:TonB-dependent receptor [candidate division KSB1 bacterium]